MQTLTILSLHHINCLRAHVSMADLHTLMRSCETGQLANVDMCEMACVNC